MSSKIKRQFLLAVKGEPSWYRAVSEKELHGRQPELQVENVLDGAQTRSFRTYRGTLAHGIAVSSGVKKDFVLALAAQMIADPTVIDSVISDSREQEVQMRSHNLLLDVLENLYDQYGESYEEKLDDLDFLRSLSDDNYVDTKYFEKAKEWLGILEQARLAVVDDGKTAAEKQAIIEPLLFSWSMTTFLIGVADEYGFDYGDGPNDYDGPSQEEIKVKFDTVKSLLQHWDEAGKTPGGKPCDSLAVGEDRRHEVYVRKDFVARRIETVV